ncbi:uncharacterized protein LOC110923548 isoform X1 [Helianthus annuus]|uniref:uncharacterized protein LOC110923175 isoform X1 n=1 Tax=Helianthus annuus TaxID=4232 RepID=UPI000B8FECF1|nr:uncharacterized protein LOC110923175 isoform X1 [Helianthus annuus]XP_022023331.1 uncharacterized protein LOC110923548 isoform X1 [Helianthus annuus]
MVPLTNFCHTFASTSKLFSISRRFTDLRYLRFIFCSIMARSTADAGRCCGFVAGGGRGQERLDQDMSGILMTMCNHSFHCSCISKWTDSSCPVERDYPRYSERKRKVE